MPPRRGKAPVGYGGRDEESSYPPAPRGDRPDYPRGGRTGRGGGGPGRGPSGHAEPEHRGGGAVGGGRGWRGGRGYVGGRGGYGGESQGPEGCGYRQPYEGRGGQGQSYGGGGRGSGRGGYGGHRGGRQPRGWDQGASSSSPGPQEGSWPAPLPPLSVLLPGMEHLSIDEAGPSTRGEEGSSSISEAVSEACSPGDKVKPELVVTSRSVLVAPKRPPPGKLGRKSVVQANHFAVKFNPEATIYHYDVEINPKVSSRGVARRLQQQLLSMHEADFKGRLPVYDGSKSLYTASALPFDSREFTVVFANENREKTFNVTIRHVATLQSSVLEEFLLGRKIAIPQEHLQALDVALREALMHTYVPLGRSFFTKSLGTATLDGGLMAWNGFFQSLRPTAQGLVLNVDLVTSVFYEHTDVIDFLRKKIKAFDPRYRLSDSMRSMVKKALARLKVEVTHRPTPRKYRIYGLSPRPAKDLRFTIERGEEVKEIGIIEYFKNTYNYLIRYPELPCLQLQASRVSYLPMEVCKICEGQKYVGKLLDAQTTNVRNLACVKPFQREGKLKEIMAAGARSGPGRGDYVASFGMSVSSQMTTVSARILQAPKLKYGIQGPVTEIVPKFGAWNMNDSCLLEGGTIDRWALIIFDRSVHRVANDFKGALAFRCKELGMNMSTETVIPPHLGQREDLEAPHLERCLSNVCGKASQELSAGGLPSTLQLLVCVLGEKNPAYGELKRICETKLGVVTQCCLSKNIKKYNSQFLANVALKINAKVGGKNNMLCLALPDQCSLLKRPTIIFGADVTHPNPGDDTSPSIAAVVANMDWPSATKYIASVRSQPHREEMIQGLKDMVVELWHKYCDKVGCRPERIIMFRDGVSEGQFDRVLQCEVHALKEAMQAVGGFNYTPHITWVVVQKRHHTRLFPADTNKDRSGNVSPGTVVDTTITHPREYDFYLCSHAGIQGTSKPTHYHVLWDENGFSSDNLQALVNNLCYTYARCTRSISVVPPAHYAHLAAYRARLYIESQGGSDTASYSSGGQTSSLASGGRTTRAAAPPVPALPKITRNVQEVMYFC